MTCLMMANNNNTNLKILQWNARGLTKSRLQEFKHFLSYSVPSVVLLSETHWNDSFTPKFSSYNVINKNRHERSGGGVAILVHNSIKFSLLPLDNSHSIEMVAISISSATFFSLNFVSVYAPKGNSTKEERRNWKKAEAVKRRHIIQAKKDSWKAHLTNLDICDDPSKLWNFVRGMLGKKISGNPLDNAVLKDLEGREYHSAQEKAGLILEAFSRNFSTLIPNNDFYETAISTSIASPTPNAFNSVITLAEIDYCLKKLKNTSMGIDLIHNKMLMRLSAVNKFYLCHLFNILFSHTYVPEKWKQAIIAPLLKSGKVAENPISYRPVALTFCLGKLFERIVSSRLDWFIESKGILYNSQVGFRRKRNITDHIVQLELDVKEGFSEKESWIQDTGYVSGYRDSSSNYHPLV